MTKSNALILYIKELQNACLTSTSQLSGTILCTNLLGV